MYSPLGSRGAGLRESQRRTSGWNTSITGYTLLCESQTCKHTSLGIPLLWVYRIPFFGIQQSQGIPPDLAGPTLPCETQQPHRYNYIIIII